MEVSKSTTNHICRHTMYRNFACTLVCLVSMSLACTPIDTSPPSAHDGASLINQYNEA